MQSVTKPFLQSKKTKDFHLTLQFLGDGIEDVQPIIDTLSDIQFEPFEIKLGNPVPFPDPFQPKGIWIECDPSAALLNLANEIQDKMRDLGYIPDHPFRAHITLGRYKEKLIKKISEIETEPVYFKMDSFCLMQSTLNQKGKTYKILWSSN